MVLAYGQTIRISYMELIDVSNDIIAKIYMILGVTMWWCLHFSLRAIELNLPYLVQTRSHKVTARTGQGKLPDYMGDGCDISTTKTLDEHCLYGLVWSCSHSIFTTATHSLGVTNHRKEKASLPKEGKSYSLDTITPQLKESTYLTVYEDEEESKESEPILTCLKSTKATVGVLQCVTS